VPELRNANRERVENGWGRLCVGACRVVYAKVLVRPEGFEPPTYGFEARRSIQLSYGRTSAHRTG
jgi:hypothetical protein